MAGVFKKLHSSDITITPVQAHKHWYDTLTLPTVATSSVYGYFTYQPFEWNISGLNNYSGSSDSVLNHTFQVSLDNLFYRSYYSNTGAALDVDYDYLFRQERLLYRKGYAIFLPSGLVGESVLKKNVVLFLTNGGTTRTFVDDQYGNILEQGASTDFVDYHNVLLYIPYNDCYKTNPSHQLMGSRQLNYQVNVISSSFDSYGENMHFNGISSNILVGKGNNLKEFNCINRNFGITFGINAANASSQQTNDENINIIITKNGFKEQINNTICTIEESVQNKYPFRIGIYNAGTNIGKLFVDRTSDHYQSSTPILMTSARIDDNNQHNITFIEYDGIMKLYLDGTLQQQEYDPTYRKTEPANDCLISIGCEGNDHYFSGSLNNIMFIKGDIEPDNITNIANSNNKNNKYVGNIFYKHGIIAITNPAYFDLIQEGTEMALFYRGTLTIRECEVNCNISDGDFNKTLNPSALERNTYSDDYIYKDAITGSCKPYITTVGLYDDDNNLLVVGKLTQAIQKPDGMDLSIVMRFDI